MPVIRDVDIYVNQQKVDYRPVETLPFSLDKFIDDIFELGGLDGISPDNIANKVVLPASKNNERVLLSIDRADTFDQDVKGLVDVLIVINGQDAYSGRGLVTSITNNGQFPQAYGLELLGDGLNLLDQLNSILLTQLPFEDFDTTDAGIVNSWTDVDTPAVCAPVFYGDEGAGSELNIITFPFFRFNIDELRPHVKFWKVFELIFEDLLGYRIVSDMYQSDFFRGQTHYFTVGEQWKRTDDFEDYSLCVEGVNQTGDNSAGTNEKSFKIVMNPIYDNAPTPQWNVYFFEPQKTGCYLFTIYVEINTKLYPDAVIELVEYNMIPGITSSGLGLVPRRNVITEIDVNKKVITEEFKLHPPVSPGTIALEITVPAGEVYVIDVARMKVELTDCGSMGGSVNLKTCLPEKTAAEFIAGVMHLNGAALYYSNVRREVYFEHRFVNQKNRPVVQGFSEDSWYKYPAYDPFNPKLSDIDVNQEEINDEQVFPFGDSLTIGMKSSTDPLQEYYEENVNTSDILFGDVLSQFTQTNKQGQTKRNPYFEECLNIDFSNYLDIPPDPGIVGPIYSAILPEAPPRDAFQRPTGSAIEDFQELLDKFPASYESDPKVGFYHGLVDFNQGYWSYDTDWTGSGVMPALFTRFPQVNNAFLDGNGIPRINMCYNDLTYSIGPDDVEVLGLVSRFYLQLLAIAMEGRSTEGEVSVDYNEFIEEDFRNIRTIRKEHENALILLNEYKNYKILDSTVLDFIGYYMRGVTQDDLDRITQNEDNFYYGFDLSNVDNICS